MSLFEISAHLIALNLNPCSSWRDMRVALDEGRFVCCHTWGSYYAGCAIAHTHVRAVQAHGPRGTTWGSALHQLCVQLVMVGRVSVHATHGLVAPRRDAFIENVLAEVQGTEIRCEIHPLSPFASVQLLWSRAPSCRPWRLPPRPAATASCKVPWIRHDCNPAVYLIVRGVTDH